MFWRARTQLITYTYVFQGGRHQSDAHVLRQEGTFVHETTSTYEEVEAICDTARRTTGLGTGGRRDDAVVSMERACVQFVHVGDAEHAHANYVRISERTDTRASDILDIQGSLVFLGNAQYR